MAQIERIGIDGLSLNLARRFRSESLRRFDCPVQTIDISREQAVVEVDMDGTVAVLDPKLYARFNIGAGYWYLTLRKKRTE